MKFLLSQLLILISVNLLGHSSDPIDAAYESPSYWSETAYFSEGLGKAIVNDTAMFVDRSGKVKITLKGVENVGEFSEGLCAIGRKGSLGYFEGYIDRQGKLVISGGFYTAGAFSDGLAAVSDERGWYYIDKTGKPLQGTQRYHLAMRFRGGYGFVSGHGFDSPGKDPRIIDVKGRVVREGWWNLGRFSEDRAFAWNDNGQISLVDSQLKVIPVGISLDDAGKFSEGLAPVISGHKGYFINKLGIPVVSLGRVLPCELSQGLAAAYFIDKAAWGFIDSKGKVKIGSKFKMAKSFACGRAAVYNGEKWGFIDTEGKLVVPYQYAETGDYSDDVAGVNFGGPYPRDNDYGYIDLDGKVIFRGATGMGRVD